MSHPTARRLLGAVLALVLAGCTGTKPPTSAEPTHSTTPTITRPTAEVPMTYRYTVVGMKRMPPIRVGQQKLLWRTYIHSPNATSTARSDPYAGHAVEPELCREPLRTFGVRRDLGDFVPSDAPAVMANQEGQYVGGDRYTWTAAVVTELTGARADLYLDRFTAPPAECRSAEITGVGRASVTNTAVPGFGQRARYLTRSVPFQGGRWIERRLLYRTKDYVVEIGVHGRTGTDAGFLAFAGQVRDIVQANLKTG